MKTKYLPELILTITGLLLLGINLYLVCDLLHGYNNWRACEREFDQLLAKRDALLAR